VKPMIAASQPVQRPADAKLIVIRSNGSIEHWARSALVDLLRPGDLLIANDAATLPASLAGIHVRTGRPIEVRLAGRRSLEPTDVSRFRAVIFGAGNFRTRTEDRPPPPGLTPGDRIQLGPLNATVERLESHPRLALLRFDGSAAEIWSALARHGKPIQYAHVRQPLALWDVWTPIAGALAAFEPPSASFTLSWSMVRALRTKGVEFATLTHAAGISSTGDPQLDARLPFDEPYRIPQYTVDAIAAAKQRRARVIAVGTTVVRALEDAAQADGQVTAGTGIATLKIGPTTVLRVIDALVSGTHERGTSHYELLRAFVPSSALDRMEKQLDSHGYKTHEFGDSILVEKATGRPSDDPLRGRAHQQRRRYNTGPLTSSAGGQWSSQCQRESHCIGPRPDSPRGIAITRNPL
jgi:S-adenosylmethionine:tRNA ribosyltransferase-isomerase